MTAALVFSALPLANVSIDTESSNAVMTVALVFFALAAAVSFIALGWAARHHWRFIWAYFLCFVLSVAVLFVLAALSTDDVDIYAGGGLTALEADAPGR